MRRLVIGVVALIAAGLLGAQQGSPPAPVRVVSAVRTDMAALTWVPGTLVSRNDARIAGEAPGQLTWVAEVGDMVDKGAPVARIDDAALQLQLKNDAAQIKRLEADLAFVEQQLTRRRQLAEEQIISTNDLEETQSQRETSHQNLEAARVAREQTLFWISRSTVRAPFAGKIVARLQQPGGYTTTGQDIVRLVDVDDVEVQVQAPLSVEPFLEEGMAVAVEGRGQKATGTIARVVRVGDQRSRMFEVRIALQGEPGVVGSAVRVGLPTSAPRQVVAVPRDALVLRSDSVYLFRITDDSTAERLAVETGVGNSDLIEILGNVAAGDRVVVRGGERLRPGQAVTVSDG